MRAGINANFHREFVHNTTGALVERFGVEYQGDGEWTLPNGAKIEPLDGDNWLLTLKDGTELHVWSEEE